MLKRMLLLVALLMPLPALAQMRWQEGREYSVLAGNTTVEARPGKIEVAEVFSYACPFCYQARDDMAKLQATLPADVYMAYVHASFRPDEAWPMYQRAFYTAQALGIASTLHDRTFRAVWDTGELPLLDAARKVRKPLPTIQEAAHFYARAMGKITEAQFLKTAGSPAVDAAVKRADALVKQWHVPGTPALIVNGHYMIEGKYLQNWGESQALVLYLVGLERQRMARPAPQPPAAKPAVKP